METTLTVVMNEISNHFTKSAEKGNFSITEGVLITAKTYPIESYIRIVGSVANDGVYKVVDNLITLDGAVDEDFTGFVYGLAVPRGLIELVAEVQQFNERAAEDKNGGTVVSESWTDYSYQLVTNSNGMAATWKEVFASRLNDYRRMFDDPAREMKENNYA